jgi:hypothetical protein
MTKLAQVGHVMMKDLREARWLLAVYFGIAALATAHAMRLKGFDGEGFGFLMLLVVLLGMIVVGSLVQADSPTRADAFWATRPLHPSAMLAAKFTLAVLLVIVMPSAGQLAGLLAHHVAARDVPRALVASTLKSGRWLLLAMVIAAITWDLRTFLIALVAIPVFFLSLAVWGSSSASQAALSEQSAGYAVVPPAIMPSLFVVGGVALLVYLYRSRDVRPRTWIAGSAVFVAGMLSSGTSTPKRPIPDVPPDVPRTSVRLELSPNGPRISNGNASIAVKLVADSVPSAQRLTLIGGIAVFHLRDGTESRARISEYSNQHFEHRGTTGTTWLGEQSDLHVAFRSSVIVPDSVERRIETGLTSLGMEGRVLVSSAAFADTLPLRVGASVARSGTLKMISKVSYGLGHASLTLINSDVLLDPPQAFPQPFINANALEFALVNDARREAIVLEPRAGFSQSGWLVLPGIQTSEWSQSLVTWSQYLALGGSPVDDAWFRDARLVITHWMTRGSYPVHSEIAVP